METLTVVFTGLMLFDFTGYNAYPVPGDGHTYTVQVGNLKPIPVTKGISFSNLAKGYGSKPVGNFSILSLKEIVGKPIKLHKAGLGEPISLDHPGSLRPLADFDVCQAGSYVAVSWRGVQWDVEVAEGAIPSITIDGKITIVLTNLPTVRISNDNVSGSGSHLPMYAKGIRGQDDKPVEVRSCEASPRSSVTLLRNNPITCPPASLQ